jgi:quercetin dioxygenase-like cupin family protein
MILDFKNLPEMAAQGFKGGEGWFRANYNLDDMHRIMKAVLEPGASIGFHAHNNGSEIIYILKGEGKALYDDGEEKLSAGDVHYCPDGHSHSVINDSDSDLEFLAVVTTIPEKQA